MLAHLGSKDQVALSRSKADSGNELAGYEKQGKSSFEMRVANSLRASDINWG